MATLTPQFFQLLEAEEKTVFFNEFEQIELMFPRIFERRPSTKAYEDRIRISKLGTFSDKPEGTPISYDDPVQGTQVRTVHTTYGLGFRNTEEMMEDDQFDVIRQMPKDLAESAADHQERLAWSLVSNGFNNTFTGLEGDTLFSTTHTILKGDASVTQSNVLDPPVQLSQSGIESILTLAETMQSDEGRQVRSRPVNLVFHPNERWTAETLLETDRKPGSADNDINTITSTRTGLVPHSVPYLTSQTNWFIFANPGQNSLVWNDRRRLNMFRSQDSDTRDQKFGATYRASVMWSTWRQNFASQA